MKLFNWSITAHESKLGRILLGLFVIVMLLTGVTVTGVKAAFLDSESSLNDNFSSGTLDVTLDAAGSSVTGTPFTDNGASITFSQVAPGQSGTFTWTLTNVGTLAGTLNMTGSTCAFTEGTVTELESLFPGNVNNGGSNGDMDQYLKVTLRRGIGADAAAAIANATNYRLGSSGTPVAISGLQAVLLAESIAMSAAGGTTDTVVYILDWSLSSSDPNINLVQADTAVIHINFNLVQS